MKNLESYCIHETVLLKDVITAIQNTDERCVIVIDRDKKVIGVFSEGDVLRSILADCHLETPIKNLVKSNFRYIRENDINVAAKIFKKGYSIVPVIDKQFHLINIFTLLDYLNK
tara:strand:+ start:3744 stop:4085 length:342 start_codon:yes stop_codon:yes gene_type:complete